MASSKSGNRGSGNRKPTSTTSSGSSKSSAQDRARGNLDQRQQSGGRGGSNQRGGNQRGGGQGRGRNQRKQGLSTSAIAGIFGGAFVILAVVVIVLITTVFGSNGSVSGDPGYVPPPHADTAVTDALARVTPAQFQAAGDASALGKIPTKPSSTGLVQLDGPKLTGSNGLPQIVYLGSEYCPYCAATRWPFIIALNRFGNFNGLLLTTSSPLDIYNKTPTLTFLRAHYTSPYIDLDTTEELSNNCPKKDVQVNSEYSSTPAEYYPSKYECANDDYPILNKPSAEVSDMATKYDSTEYFGSNGANGIPFINFGGLYAEDGALYDPGLLHDTTWSQVVSALSVPTEGIGGSILPVANRYTAMICKMTGGKPGSVCNSKVIQATEKAMS